MKYKTKMKIFEEKLNKYLKANKKEKGKILDAVCEVTNLKRKQVIRNFKKLQFKDKCCFKETRGRKIIYGNEVNSLLKDIWELADRMSGELLHPIIDEYLNSFVKSKEFSYTDNSKNLLLQMSEGTIKNRIKSFRKKEGVRKKGLSGTKPSELKRIIPVFFGSWKDRPVGYGQLDTVALCGSSLAGDFMWVLNFVDIATYWSVFRFQWNKSQYATVNAFEEIIERLPFDLLGAHPDSGSEFINYLLKTFCDENKIELTRSRPNKKNDNFGVEERNGHVIRNFFGYPRLDNKILLDEFNILADKIVLFINHFKPIRRTIEKNKINSKYQRKFDKAKTPYQRVLDNDSISQEVKNRLKQEHENLDVLSLKKEIDTMIVSLLDKNRNLRNKK
jgi:hypothetical protein